jgi:AraC-like DNA-binding protein
VTKRDIPPLIFGSHRCQTDFNLLQMQARVASMTNWVSEYDVLGGKDGQRQFLHRTAVFRAENVGLLAVSSTPTVMKVNAPDYTIALPVFGNLNAWVGGRHLPIHTGQAMFFAKGKRHAEGGDKSTLLISATEDRLLATAESMLGRRAASQLDLHMSQRLTLKHGSVDLRSVMAKLCGLIDQFAGDQVLLRNFSIDENIVRVMVMMLAPAAFFEARETKSGNGIGSSRSDGDDGQLQLVCDFIMAHLDQPLNLTLLESISGLSARVLQIRFKKRFGCSPMQWVKEQRLILAHRLLRNPDADTTVSSVAAFCGYSNFGEFSKNYARKFFELPSVTLFHAARKLF